MRSGTAAGSRATSERAISISGFVRSIRSDAIFTRTTNGGASWELARAIFMPRANEFGIGHQISVVLAGPHAGRLVDVFTLFHGSGSNKKGQEIAVMVSDDRGVTWSDPITVSKYVPGFVSDPDDGTPLRTGDIIPDIGAGPNGELSSSGRTLRLPRPGPRLRSRSRSTAASPGRRRSGSTHDPTCRRSRLRSRRWPTARSA
jgi:hypothetical protein